jgi:two-component system, LytTR family, response regulator
MRRLLASAASQLPPRLLRQPSATEATTNQPTWLDGDEQIFVKQGERCWIIRVRDVDLIESKGNYSLIYFGANQAEMYRSLNYFQRRLDPTIFCRANRHYIMNLRRVKDVVSWMDGGFQVRLTSGRVIALSRRQAKTLKNQISL